MSVGEEAGSDNADKYNEDVCFQGFNEIYDEKNL